MVDHIDRPEKPDEKYLYHEQPTEFHFEAASPHVLDSDHQPLLDDNDAELEDNEMMWDTVHHTPEVSGTMECPLGYSKIGCCRCVLDTLPPEHHLTGAEHQDLAPTIHGVPSTEEHLNSEVESNAEHQHGSQQQQEQKKEQLDDGSKNLKEY